MKRNISSLSTANIWNLTDQAPVLETYADVQFDTSDNQTWYPGDPQAGTLCRRDTCSVAAGVLSVPTLTNFDTTEDSPNNQTATYSTYIRATNQQLIPWLLNYRVPVGTAAISWTTLRIHKAGVISRDPANTYTKQEVLDLLASMIASIGTSGGVLAKGNAPMTAGSAAVSNVLTAVDSIIQLTGQEAGVSGTLYISDRVPGSGFTISSSNGADEGDVGWIMLAA